MLEHTLLCKQTHRVNIKKFHDIVFQVNQTKNNASLYFAQLKNNPTYATWFVLHRISLLKVTYEKPGIVAHIWKPGTKEAERGALFESSLNYKTIPSQPGLQNETLFKKLN